MPAASLAHDAEQLTLAPGETGRAAGGRVQVRFDEVVSDSRCPTGEQCIVAGFAEIAVTVTTEGTTASYRLVTAGKEPRSLTHAGYTVTLLGLAPYPKASRTIPTAEYRATFDVQPE